MGTSEEAKADYDDWTVVAGRLDAIGLRVAAARLVYHLAAASGQRPSPYCVVKGRVVKGRSFRWDMIT